MMRLLGLSVLLSMTSAFAADLPRKGLVPSSQVAAPMGFSLCQKPAVAPVASTIATVPGGDLFGFTSATDVGSVGDCAIAFEYSARLGKIDGSFYYGTLKNQYAATIANNLQIALSPFFSHSKINNVTGYPNMSTLDFDGLSGEVLYRVLERSKGNALAITLSNETRYARLDGLFGNRVAKNFGTEFKFFADSVLIKDKLYGAFNMNYAFATSRGTDPAAVDSNASGLNFSGALAYQVNDALFFGLEARHVRSYAGHSLNTKLGHATFFGPTMLYKINDTLTFNTVWTPQVSGKSVASTGNLDLDNFERHQFRFKLVKGF